MYLRLRKLDKSKLTPGQETLMMAISKTRADAIDIRPCALEWWDGITWNPVQFVEEEDEKDPGP